jgi:hypothetical protein
MATWRTLCDKVDAIAVAGREADARHCASLLLLQAKVSKIVKKSERQIARVMISIVKFVSRWMTRVTCTALKGRRWQFQCSFGIMRTIIDVFMCLSISHTA